MSNAKRPPEEAEEGGADAAALKAEQRAALMPLPYDYRSRVLGFLDPGRTNFPATLCEFCKNAVWKATEQDLVCYCRVLFTETWTEGRKSVITACDGALLVEEEED